MKKKLTTLLLIISLLSGCKVEYQIDLDKKLNIEENIKIISTSESDKEEFKEYSMFIPIDKEVDDFEAFEKKLAELEYYNQNKSNELIELNYSFEQDEYVNSTLVNNAYEFISITKVNDDLILSTSKEFLLFDLYENLEEVKVTINSKYKLIKSNADKEERHSYTWIINKENAYGKNIYLKLDTTEEDLTFLERLKNGEYTNMFTISVLLTLIGLIIYYILKKKGDRRNKI